jgi:coenzyme PQQ precursor peptide PqqA
MQRRSRRCGRRISKYGNCAVQIDIGRAAEAAMKEGNMWRKPVIIEICLGAEINSYSSAGKK